MKSLLDDSKIRHLLGKRGSGSEFRKLRRPMVTEVLPEAHIRIQTQKLTHHPHRDHFTIGQLGSKVPLA